MPERRFFLDLLRREKMTQIRKCGGVKMECHRVNVQKRKSRPRLSISPEISIKACPQMLSKSSDGLLLTPAQVKKIQVI